MRLELFDVSRRWPRESIQSNNGASFREQRNFFTVFRSIRRPCNTFKLPRGDMDTPPRPCNFFRYLAIGMCHFRHLWNGMCDHHRAEITVMQFTGHSLPAHHFVAARRDLHLVPYFQPSSPARFLSITGHRDVSLPLSLEWHVRSSSSRNNCHAVHRSLSSGASLCGGTVRIFFTLSHIVSQAVFYTLKLLEKLFPNFRKASFFFFSKKCSHTITKEKKSQAFFFFLLRSEG